MNASVLRVLTLVAIGASTALSGCGDGGSRGVAPGAGASLAGTTYVVTAVTEAGRPRQLAEATEVRLRFDEDRVVITAGCNTMGGSYRLDGTRLTVRELAMTDMGCDQARMDQDAWLVGLFAGPVELVTGDDAAIRSGDTVLSLADRRLVSPDLPLAGTWWQLDSLVDGDVASSVPRGVVAYLRFRGSVVEVYDGCNAGSGPAEVDGSRIRFGDRTQTLRGCLGAAGDVAGAVAAVLSGPTTFRIEERTLEITRGDRTLGLRAVDKPPAHD
jgi:heat shock protein HslJ